MSKQETDPFLTRAPQRIQTGTVFGRKGKSVSLENPQVRYVATRGAGNGQTVGYFELNDGVNPPSKITDDAARSFIQKNKLGSINTSTNFLPTLPSSSQRGTKPEGPRTQTDRKQTSASQETDDLKNPNFRKATDFDKNNPFNKNNTENRQFELNRITGNSFNIDRFRAEVVGNDDVLTTHSYLVVFSPMPWVTSRATRDGIDSRLTMRCDNAILPTVSLLQEQNIRRYGFGPVENVAYGVNVGDFTLQFIVDKRGTIVDFFEAWLNRIVNRDSFGGANMNNALRDGKRPYEVAYKDTYVCPSVNVFVYDRSQNTVMEYNIYDVFPTGIQSMNLSWGEENSLMKLNVTFSFTDLRIHPKFSNFDNQQIVPVADTLKSEPIAVTVATMDDKPLVDQLTSVNLPADLANQPFVLGEGTNGALRGFGTPGDTPAADDGGATGSSDVRASTRRTPLGPPY